jgi:copper(I)-binding protein
MRTRKLLLAVVVLAWSLPMCVWSANGIEIEDAWVREGPPNAPVLAGYLRIYNNGSDAVSITAAESPDVPRIELHRTEMQEGVARMIEMKSVEVEPGQSVRFEPGGMHLMLFDPARPLREGDTLDLWLITADGTRHPTTANVRKATGDAHHHHHQH